MASASIAPESGPPSRDDADVPALALCLVCGRADCAGCDAEAPRAPRAGATPWETDGGPRLRRLVKTAHLTTVDGEAFFGGLGDGSVSAALAFAVTCEFLAILSLSLFWAPVVYAFVPGLVESAFEGERRQGVVLGVLLCVPALTLLMVLLHVAWALGLETGLRVAGARGRTLHCLRYALYSCGWDLVTSPFGFGAGLVTGGWDNATTELRAAFRIPRTATNAYLVRSRQTGERTARRALVVAAVITGGLVLAGAVGLGVALVWAMI
ncbi:MAG TPA: hypothetical protein VHE30_16680 [Polyangiaceae bacterium]|nr:hypothetical protein [Polyangiaceae bacterium]